MLKYSQKQPFSILFKKNNTLRYKVLKFIRIFALQNILQFKKDKI